MTNPSPSPRALKRVLATVVPAGLLTGSSAASADDGARRAVSEGWRVQGRVRGTLPGLGPQLRLEAWLRPAARDLRAELRFEGPQGPAHETLVWTPEAAVLFDRRTLKYTALGESAGRLDAFEASFRVEELWWLLLGAREDQWLPRARFEVVDGELRGKSPGRGYRRPLGPRPAWTEILWRDSGGRVHVLRGWRRRSLDDERTPLALGLELEGSDLRGRLRLELQDPQAIALGDSILDPIWEPERD